MLATGGGTYDMNQQWWFEDPNAVGAQPHADGWSTPASGQIMSSAAQTCVTGGQVDQVQLAQCADGTEQQWQARASVTVPASGESPSSAAAPAVPGSRTAAVRSGRASLASDPAAAPVGAFFFVNRSSGQCLDYDRTNDEVLQWERNGGDNQQWYHYGDTLRSVYNGQCLKPGENSTLVTTDCSTAPEEWEGGIEPKDKDRVSFQSATGLAMDLTAGDTSAGTKILGWTPCRCKNNQILETVGGGWYRIVRALDGTNVTAVDNGEPLSLREPTNDLGQLWKITLNNRSSRHGTVLVGP